MTFFERYEMLCKEIDKTPTGVGNELGTDGATVNYWKKDHIPTSKALIKIANYFDVSIDYLCCRSDIRKPEVGFTISEHERALLIAYRSQPSMQTAVDRTLGISEEEYKKKKRA